MGRMRTFFNNRYQNAKRAVTRGLNTKGLKDTSLMVWDVAKSFFEKREIKPETFEEARARLNVTDRDLADRVFSLRRDIIIYSLGTLAVVAYAIYLGITGNHFFSVLITLLVATVFGILAFRSHFWLFQIKHQKLGCTLQDWLNSSVKGGQ